MFRRVLLGLDLADGDLRLTDTYSSPGPANATHTEPFVALPSNTGSALASSDPKAEEELRQYGKRFRGMGTDRKL